MALPSRRCDASVPPCAFLVSPSRRWAARRRRTSGTARAARDRTAARSRPACTHEQVARGGAAAVRERVVAAARGERDRAGAGGRQLVAELERELALEDVERLVEFVVMQRRAGPARGHGDLDDPDAVVAVPGAQQHGGIHRLRLLDPLGDHLGGGVDARHLERPVAGVREAVHRARRHDDDLPAAGDDARSLDVEPRLAVGEHEDLAVGMAVWLGAPARRRVGQEERDRDAAAVDGAVEALGGRAGGEVGGGGEDGGGGGHGVSPGRSVTRRNIRYRIIRYQRECWYADVMARRPASPPLGLKLARTARVVTTAFDRALAEAGGSAAIWQVLLLVRSGEWGTQSSMAEAMGVTAATVTHHLNGLEAQGLVRRRRDDANRRVQRVELTPDGAELFGRLRRVATRHDERLRSQLGAGEAAALAELLAKLAAGVAAPATPPAGASPPAAPPEVSRRRGVGGAPPG